MIKEANAIFKQFLEKSDTPKEAIKVWFCLFVYLIIYVFTIAYFQPLLGSPLHCYGPLLSRNRAGRPGSRKNLENRAFLRKVRENLE